MPPRGLTGRKGGGGIQMEMDGILEEENAAGKEKV
jgi:hypothetical protein